jgi:small subunit ribosomal protein S1
MEDNVKKSEETIAVTGGDAVEQHGMTIVADEESKPEALEETVVVAATEPPTNGNGANKEAAPAPTESSPAEPESETENEPLEAATAAPEAEAPATEPESESEELEAATAVEPVSPMSFMEQLLNEPSSAIKALHYGEVIEGIVMHRDRDEILVDIGAKSEGIVPNKELQTLTPAELVEIKIGDQILVFVVQPENQEGHAVLSIDKAKMEKSWRRLQKQFEAGEIIEAEVTGYNKGGLLVNLEGVRGFVPASQVTGLATGNEASKQSEMTRLVNNKLPLKIIEINRHRNRLILSERLAAQEQRDAQKDRLMQELAQGQVREGIVTSICDFGAFVDIGGADGLVHLSELSWSRINHPGELLKVNEKVKVFVLSVDENEKKVALSIKRTQPEPWSQVMATYQPGQLVKGVITQLANFGAFARIADGIEGLIHVSELAEGRVQHPRSVVKEGDEVELRIIRIDPQRKRMGLSLKRAAPDYAGNLTDFSDEEENGGGRRKNRSQDEGDESAPAESAE